MTTFDSVDIKLSLTPYEASDSSIIFKKLKQKPELKGFPIKSFLIKKKSIDARKKNVKINLELIVSSEDRINLKTHLKEYKKISPDSKTVIIIGSGPSGLFAGLRAIEKGLKPIIIERGKDVDSRRKDIALISRENIIDPNSNFCFGEGGAGTFSDGKLFTRSKKRGNVKEVLEILNQFGASEEILISSHPHIGSDRLPSIIKSIREKIIECGGNVIFNTKMEELILDGKKVIGIKTSEGEILEGPVFLGIGHSSRDTYRMLSSKGVRLEAKGLAIGVRVEHPQELIDKMQYHTSEGRGKYLPPAEYSFVNQLEGRGVYTFCMCPGGVIVPAISDKGQIVVNGMSASSRSGRWANSGYVVEVHPGDVPGFGVHGEFEMLELQEFLEEQFSKESNGKLNAPAQRIPDFINEKASKDLPKSSYAPGIHEAELKDLFPIEISSRLKHGLKKIGEKCPEFISEQGIMVGLESRTSSPIRIPRNSDTLQHEDIEDLYPMGEGAGYSGGIISSAIDGMRCIDAYCERNGINS